MAVYKRVGVLANRGTVRQPPSHQQPLSVGLVVPLVTRCPRLMTGTNVECSSESHASRPAACSIVQSSARFAEDRP